MLRLVHAPPRTSPHVLGYALIDAQRRQGTLATVYVDRVYALAAAAPPMARGTLLGRAIAHELMHLLSGSSAHAREGLMRAHWRLADVRQNRPADWILSSRDVATIRRQLAARLARPPVHLAEHDSGEHPSTQSGEATSSLPSS